MRPHRRASLFKLFCCQIVRSLNALHFRICDVSSESTSIESLADRYAGAWLQLSESFSEHNSMATEIVAIVCAIAVSRRKRFTSRERVRQTVACRQAFACSVFVALPLQTRIRTTTSLPFRKTSGGTPPFAFGVIPCSQRLQIGHPRLDSSLLPTVPLRGSVETMPRASCRRQSRHHDVMGWS
jgi:hypothetical protein